MKKFYTSTFSASRRRFLRFAVGMSLLATSSWTLAKAPENLREEVLFFAQETADLHALPLDWVVEALKKAKFVPLVERLMTPATSPTSPKQKNWVLHKTRAVNAERIEKGLAFLSTYQKELDEVTEHYRVPREVIVAILGIETIYGKTMGKIRVLDSLSTLSFDYLRRADYFKNELAFFLSYCYKNGFAPESITGSYAGAIGMCQFMPPNIPRLCVDFDKDGKIDIIASAPDAIASVANYLKNAGWNASLPMAWQCDLTEELAERFKPGFITTSTTIQNALDAGIRPKELMEVDPETEVFLVDLPIESMKNPRCEWRLATCNYAAVLNYNRSYFYAESVRELAIELTRSRTEESIWSEIVL